MGESRGRDREQQDQEEQDQEEQNQEYRRPWVLPVAEYVRRLMQVQRQLAREEGLGGAS